MKELSIEQKAKAYDKALSVALETYKTQPMYRDWLEKMFPELKESEGEKISREITEFLVDFNNGEYERPTEDIIDEWLSWLEKQGESQVRTGIEWVNTIDDACDKRYSEEYAHGEYCHEQSFKWGFQEGVDWLEKQGKKGTKGNDED